MTSDDDWAIAAPAFQPDEALQRLQRDLRGLGLSERDGQFERRGTVLARAAVAGQTLALARVKRPTRGRPEWLEKTARHSSDVRDFVADLKRQLALWQDGED